MGKYIHLFQTKEEFNQAVENNYIEPWVSYTEQGDMVDYNKKNYFTIEATEDNTYIYFRQSSYAVSAGMPALKVQVSTDGGKTWTEKTASAENSGTEIANLDPGQKILIKGNNQAYGYRDESEGEPIENCNFWADKPCYVYGNIMSLVGGDGYAAVRSVNEYAFSYFFSDYDGEFNWSWILSKDEEPLILSATTLADFCYCNMFFGCRSLTTAPNLPATTLASSCYDTMFSGCKGLTSAPELPATTLAVNCYYGMFGGCTSLTTAPDLPAKYLVPGCYDRMFNSCTHLNYVKAMFTTVPGNTYTEDWLYRVSATGVFVKNSAATWNVTGNSGVPTGWTVETASK